MAGYGSKQVNVGAMVDPGAGVTRALLGIGSELSKREDRKLAREDALAVKAENDRRWNLQQQDRSDAKELQQRKENALASGNKFFIDTNEGRNPDFERSDYNNYFQKQFKDQEARWSSQEKTNRDYLLSDGSNKKQLDSAVDSLLGKSNKDDQKLMASRDQRRERLGIVRRAIAAAPTKEAKNAIADKAILDMFGERRAELNRSIAEGSFLTNNQKTNAIMRRAPEDFKRYGDVSGMHRNIMATMSGPTKKELLDKDRRDAAKATQANAEAYQGKVDAYKAELKERKGGKDWKALSATLQRSLGSLDDSDKENIVNAMIAKGIPHDRINFAVEQLIDKHWYGTESIPAADSEEVNKAITLIADDMRSKNPNYDKKLEAPTGGYEIVPERTLNEIQADMFRSSGSKVGSSIQLLDSWDKYKAGKAGVPDAILLKDYNVGETNPKVGIGVLSAGNQTGVTPMVTNGEFNPSKASIDDVISQKTSYISPAERERISKLDPELQVRELKIAEDKGKNRKLSELRAIVSSTVPKSKSASANAFAILDAEESLPVGYAPMGSVGAVGAGVGSVGGVGGSLNNLKAEDALFVATGKALGKSPTLVMREDIKAFLGTEKGKEFASSYDRNEAAKVSRKKALISMAEGTLNRLDPVRLPSNVTMADRIKAKNTRTSGKYTDEYITDSLENAPLIPSEVKRPTEIFTRGDTQNRSKILSIPTMADSAKAKNARISGGVPAGIRLPDNTYSSSAAASNNLTDGLIEYAPEVRNSGASGISDIIGNINSLGGRKAAAEDTVRKELVAAGLGGNESFMENPLGPLATKAINAYRTDQSRSFLNPSRGGNNDFDFPAVNNRLDELLGKGDDGKTPLSTLARKELESNMLEQARMDSDKLNGLLNRSGSTAADYIKAFDGRRGKAEDAVRKELIAAGIANESFMENPLGDLSLKALENYNVNQSIAASNSRSNLLRPRGGAVVEQPTVDGITGAAINDRSNILTNPVVPKQPTIDGATISDRSNVLPAPTVTTPTVRDKTLPKGYNTVEQLNKAVKKYETDNVDVPNSKRKAHPNPPEALKGEAAVKEVERLSGRKLTDLEKLLVHDEGYSKEVYLDTKGNLTVGVGQTGEFMDRTPIESMAIKIAKSKRLAPGFDSMPEDVQYSLLQAVYRGDVTKDHKWLKMINVGDYQGAAVEVLKHKGYQALVDAGITNGITRRIERASKVFGNQPVKT